MHAPDIRYAKSGNVSIAYQVIGEGPTDLVFVPGFISNIGFIWEQPLWRGFLHRLASFSRLVLLDKRGTGLSDRTRDLPTLETRMDDLRAVLDAIDSGRAALLGVHEGSKLAALHAATHPERTAALVLFAPSARGTRTPDYPWAQTPEELQRDLRDIEESWGARSFLERVLARYDPAGLEDHEFRDWFVAYMRFSASPSASPSTA